MSSGARLASAYLEDGHSYVARLTILLASRVSHRLACSEAHMEQVAGHQSGVECGQKLLLCLAY